MLSYYSQGFELEPKTLYNKNRKKEIFCATIFKFKTSKYFRHYYIDIASTHFLPNSISSHAPTPFEIHHLFFNVVLYVCMHKKY